MGAPEHRIGRVVFEIAAADDGDLDRFGGMLRARFDAVVLPVLQGALDRIDRPGELIRLGRVEVDLGRLDSALPEAQELGRRLSEGLAAALRAAPAIAVVENVPVRDDAAEFIAFLESGELPWSEPGRALASLASALLTMDAAAMASLAAQLRVVLIRRRAVERLVRQLPAALVRRILRALLPEVLAVPLAQAFGADVPKAVGESTSAAVPDALVTELVEVLLCLARGTELPDLGNTIAVFATLDGRAPVFAAVPPAAPPMAREDVAPAARDAPPAEQAAEVVDTDTETDAVAAARPVYAAGAVLLHPFLGALFERLGMLAAPDRFRDSAARARAVLLTHHLASGAEDIPEPETILFKLLCGMPPAEPLPRRLKLTEAERTEADVLLTRVIEHWQRLGHASPAALREGFLTRPGRLERGDGSWRLSVEPRGIDVLLDDLPWVLSRVKTPFMDAIMTVEWR